MRNPWCGPWTCRPQSGWWRWGADSCPNTFGRARQWVWKPTLQIRQRCWRWFPSWLLRHWWCLAWDIMHSQCISWADHVCKQDHGLPHHRGEWYGCNPCSPCRQPPVGWSVVIVCGHFRNHVQGVNPWTAESLQPECRWDGSYIHLHAAKRWEQNHHRSYRGSVDGKPRWCWKYHQLSWQVHKRVHQWDQLSKSRWWRCAKHFWRWHRTFWPEIPSRGRFRVVFDIGWIPDVNMSMEIFHH